MAYGSPERLADVPAYYADIRGGRPIAPEHLEDLVQRYRRLGIEDSNPLNEITERTRAALERELGFPVCTGMRHWQPRIVEAVQRALAGGAGPTAAHVVFTAHSLPARILEEHDPYQDELLATADAVAREALLDGWSFAYQSESPTGEPWLGPDILPHLEQLHGRGVRKVLVCPIG